MRPRHTRRTDKELAGATVQRATRLPAAQVDAVLEAVDRGIPEVHSFTDAVTDALWLWLYELDRTAVAYKVSRPAAAAPIQERPEQVRESGLVIPSTEPQPELEVQEDGTMELVGEDEMVWTGASRPDFGSIPLPPADGV